VQDSVLRSSPQDLNVARFFAARSPATYGVRRNAFGTRREETVAGRGKGAPDGAPCTIMSDGAVH
jgi:hypothetical protein